MDFPGLQMLSDIIIEQINSLGGPPLPLGLPVPLLKVAMENVTASRTAPVSCRVASTLTNHRVQSGCYGIYSESRRK